MGLFLFVFALVAVLEILSPRRALTASKAGRWVANLAIVALNPLSVRLVFPVLPVGTALFWFLIPPFNGDPGRIPINRH